MTTLKIETEVKIDNNITNPVSSQSNKKGDLLTSNQNMEVQKMKLKKFLFQM